MAQCLWSVEWLCEVPIRYYAPVQLGESRRTANVIAGATTAGKSIEGYASEVLQKQKWVMMF
jgi:hypothetical protein